jgi:hypothetical protein
MNTPGACPFCQSKNTVLVGAENKWKYVHCNDCGADGPPDLGVSGAVDAWNKPHMIMGEVLRLLDLKTIESKIDRVIELSQELRGEK